MDNILHFEPLWLQEECITKPGQAIDDIVSDSLKISLEQHRSIETATPCIEEVIADVTYTIEKLLWSPPRDNAILNHIISIAAYRDIDPVLTVKEAILKWYESAVPITARDPQQGLPPDAEIEIGPETILRWNRRYSAETHAVGNSGVIAMMLASKAWYPPVNDELRRASLVSNATASILFATYLISSSIDLTHTAIYTNSMTSNNEPMKLFLKTMWHIAREGSLEFDFPPAAEYGASQEEVKLSHDGKRLLSKVGQESWSEASIWHPCRRIPGSPWNKFIRNKHQKLFLSPRVGRTQLALQLPSSSLSLAEPWEIYYSELRSRFDQTNRQRKHPSEQEKLAQFRRLAMQTGMTYKATEYTEQSASVVEDVEQEYLYTIPMVKKHATDLAGQLTMPFLTTAARAFRFEGEPDEVEPELSVMTFQGMNTDE